MIAAPSAISEEPVPAASDDAIPDLPSQVPATAANDSSELLSLHFKEGRLEPVIAMLSDRGRNFRYAIHPDVADRKIMGLYLENLSWREALAVVARLHQLVITEEHGTVIIDSYENAMNAEERDTKRARLTQERAEIERSTLDSSLKTKRLAEDGSRAYRSFKLKYAEPNEARAYLEKIFNGAAPLTRTKQKTGGAIGVARGDQIEQTTWDNAADDNSASGQEDRLVFSTFTKASILTAYGTQADLEAVALRIAEIDVPQQQIFIESRIVEVSRNYSRSLGVQWGGGAAMTTGSAFPATVGLAGSAQVATPGQLPGGATGTAAGSYAMGVQGSAVDLPASDPSNAGALPAGLSIALADVAGTSALNMRISALERDGKGKTLSNPKLTTINGVRAKIASGREIPYQQSAGGSSGATTIAFKNAVIALEVTPFITPDNRISLKIVARKDDADFTNQVLNVPSILTRSVETSVMVGDGGTAVLGGVFENVEADAERGVPVLSKLPLVGWLFKGSDRIDNEKELLIFITPRIVKGTYS